MAHMEKLLDTPEVVCDACALHSWRKQREKP